MGTLYFSLGEILTYTDEVSLQYINSELEPIFVPIYNYFLQITFCNTVFVLMSFQGATILGLFAYWWCILVIC